MMRDIKSMDLEELSQALSELGEPKFRAGQVFTWLHRGARSFEETVREEVRLLSAACLPDLC